MTTLRVGIEGETGSGKSTVLLLLAQYLSTLGYTVEIPNHLVGLGVNTEVLHRPTSEQTLAVFTEQNLDSTISDNVAVASTNPDNSDMFKDYKCLEEQIKTCYAKS